MHRRILKRTILFLLITTFVAFTLQINDDNVKDEKISRISNDQYQRIKRATVRKPGFFRTLFSVIYEQWNDTRNTVGTVNKLVNDNFLPENAPPVETTTSADPNATTKAPQFRISRNEFNRILRRNLKGIIRLYNIELKDALKQSDKNYAEFKKNASIEVSKFL
ncbi:PREDICTED: uncharacterized protein LOC108561995 [Nicrophorus vespilloides]|uniref:Uncharacterized protein LOC108561995 n=1 Tax=Nicrophorus vespilloides TaxID=110193 RepID=A0ABM1MM50_NICVS|nr:PREDICTED: uncharacterized protein LOC108561995 [Nicrophorus vespilloides]XP_017775650.1 PREDICTED: uncharacterized protein LOC108561995 [Nicrophorus vespilloides]